MLFCFFAFLDAIASPSSYPCQSVLRVLLDVCRGLPTSPDLFVKCKKFVPVFVWIQPNVWIWAHPNPCSYIFGPVGSLKEKEEASWVIITVLHRMNPLNHTLGSVPCETRGLEDLVWFPPKKNYRILQRLRKSTLLAALSLFLLLTGVRKNALVSQ